LSFQIFLKYYMLNAHYICCNCCKNVKIKFSFFSYAEKSRWRIVQDLLRLRRRALEYRVLFRRTCRFPGCGCRSS
jgi:hypothetical protein